MVSDPGFRTLSTSCILQDRNSLSTGSWCWSLVPPQEESKEVERVVTASDGGWGGTDLDSADAAYIQGESGGFGWGTLKGKVVHRFQNRN